MITLPIPFSKYVSALTVKRSFTSIGVPAVIKPCPAGWRVVITRKELI